MSQRRIERRASALREVTVRLHGWPREVRTLSVVEACWMVTLEFKCPDPVPVTRTHTVFESSDYAAAFAKYEAFRQIVKE